MVIRIFEIVISEPFALHKLEIILIVGGDAKRRTEVYKMICQAGDTNPKYDNSISRLFIFRENGITPLKLNSISQHCPKLTGTKTEDLPFFSLL